MNLENKFFAIYKNHGIILFFDDQIERDTFVEEEWCVYPDIKAVEYDDIKELIKDREPEFDKSFDSWVFDIRVAV